MNIPIFGTDKNCYKMCENNCRFFLSQNPLRDVDNVDCLVLAHFRWVTLFVAATCTVPRFESRSLLFRWTIVPTQPNRLQKWVYWNVSLMVGSSMVGWQLMDVDGYILRISKSKLWFVEIWHGCFCWCQPMLEVLNQTKACQRTQYFGMQFPLAISLLKHVYQTMAVALCKKDLHLFFQFLGTWTQHLM